MPNPVWRQTFDNHTGELIESRAITLFDSRDDPIPGGYRDLKAVIWYGQKYKSPKKSRKGKSRRFLTRNVQCCTAVFLFEACVLLAAGAQWAGSWTQKLYGTGTADIGEIGTTHRKMTKGAYQEG